MSDRCGLLCPHSFDGLVQRLRIGFPVQINQTSLHSRLNVIRGDRQSPIKHSSHVRPTAKKLIADGKLSESKRISRIQLHRALQIAQSFLVLPLPAQNIAGELVNPWIVR